MKERKIQATWDLSLMCDCPACEEFVDLLKYADFWEDHDELKVCETRTESSRSLEVVCPECGEEFYVECNY
jgi:hypothetical protein